VVLTWVLTLFSSSDGGVWGYLRSRDNNKTRLAVVRDQNRTQVELERERRMTSRELLEVLPEGAEYRDSTTAGWREIRKPQVSPAFFFAVADADGEPQQTIPEPGELPGRHPRALGGQDAPEPQQP
jgi:hypothetical protein